MWLTLDQCRVADDKFTVRRAVFNRMRTNLRPGLGPLALRPETLREADGIGITIPRLQPRKPAKTRDARMAVVADAVAEACSENESRWQLLFHLLDYDPAGSELPHGFSAADLVVLLAA